MSDLIERQMAIDALIDALAWTWSGTWSEKAAIDAIKNLPSVDAIPVVRCKDCKHLFDGDHNANCCELLMEKVKWIMEITVDENWYCKGWERRTDETD